MVLSSVKKKFPQICVHSFLLIFVFLSIYPFFWMAISSMKTLPDFASNMWGLPKEVKLDNYVVAWETGMNVYFKNSVIITSITVASVVFLGALAAYPFARANFPGRTFLYLYLLWGMMVPISGIIIPIFYLAINFNFINTYLALILPYIALNLPFAVLVMRGFYANLPRELEDAARIDGCSEFRIFLRIILPISLNGFITVAIFTFINVWNEFFLALIMIQSNEMKTLPLGLARFTVTIQQGSITNYPALFAAILIATLPIIILFTFLQKYFIRGITEGGVKF